MTSWLGNMKKLSITLIILFPTLLHAEPKIVSGIYTWGFESSHLFSCEDKKEYIAFGTGLYEYNAEIRALGMQGDWHLRVDYVIFLGEIVEEKVWNTAGIGDRKIIVSHVISRIPNYASPCEGYQYPQPQDHDTELF